MATIYLSLMGKEGLIKLAEINLSRATYAKEQLAKIPHVKFLFDGPTFNEFVIQVPHAHDVLAGLTAKKIFGGIWLPRYYEELPDAVLVCVTEMNTKEQIDLFVEELKRL
jgi:glycine dehydrogenase subunit 1